MVLRLPGSTSLSYRSIPAWLLLAGIFVVGLALRLYCLDCHSLWYDEVASIEVAQRGLAAIFTDRFGWMRVQTPFHYLLVWLTIQPVDPTVTSVLVRLPSALAGALTPLVVYGLGKEMFGRAQGLFAALLMSMAVIHLEYSQDVRPYTTLTLFTAVSVYCLLVAERTEAGRWWATFAAAMVVNVLNSYNVVSLVLPALAPYLVWVLWKLWRQRGESLNARAEGEGRSRPFLYMLLSLLVSGGASVLILVDMLQVPRTPPDFSAFPLVTLLISPVEMVVWFTHFGVGGPVERLGPLLLLLLAMLGAFAAIRQRQRRGAVVCLLLILAPATILAILSTSNVVYQRYALFVMPFYYLLIGNGLVAVANLGRLLPRAGTSARPLRVAASIVAAIVLWLSAYSAGHYLVERPSVAINHADFRQVAFYLNEQAKACDVIVFAGWEPAASMFYWKNRPPAEVYSILDPLLLRREVECRIFWVISYDFDLPEQMLAHPRWDEVRLLYGVTIFREDIAGGAIISGMERLVADLEAVPEGVRVAEQAVNALQGAIHQAHGRSAQAAYSYRVAGSLYPIGDEYLKTSQEFALRDERENAWRDAMMSKNMQPENRELHRWLAQMLVDMGRESEGHIEAQIAEALNDLR